MLTVHSVGLGMLLCGEGRIFVKGGIEETTCIMDGGFLGNEVSEDLIELVDHFNLECTGFPLFLSRVLVSTISESRLTLLSKGWCILAHVSVANIDTLECC